MCTPFWAEFEIGRSGRELSGIFMVHLERSFLFPGFFPLREPNARFGTDKRAYSDESADCEKQDTYKKPIVKHKGETKTLLDLIASLALPQPGVFSRSEVLCLPSRPESLPCLRHPGSGSQIHLHYP